MPSIGLFPLLVDPHLFVFTLFRLEFFDEILPLIIVVLKPFGFCLLYARFRIEGEPPERVKKQFVGLV